MSKQLTNGTLNLDGTHPLEWNDLWSAMRPVPHAWMPTTENMYWHMLEVVPPVAACNGAFLVGEADHHNADHVPVYACFKQASDQYEARYMTVAEFHGLAAVRA